MPVIKLSNPIMRPFVFNTERLIWAERVVAMGQMKDPSGSSAQGQEITIIHTDIPTGVGQKGTEFLNLMCINTLEDIQTKIDEAKVNAS